MARVRPRPSSSGGLCRYLSCTWIVFAVVCFFIVLGTGFVLSFKERTQEILGFRGPYHLLSVEEEREVIVDGVFRMPKHNARSGSLNMTRRAAPTVKTGAYDGSKLRGIALTNHTRIARSEQQVHSQSDRGPSDFDDVFYFQDVDTSMTYKIDVCPDRHNVSECMTVQVSSDSERPYCHSFYWHEVARAWKGCIMSMSGTFSSENGRKIEVSAVVPPHAVNVSCVLDSCNGWNHGSWTRQQPLPLPGLIAADSKAAADGRRIARWSPDSACVRSKDKDKDRRLSSSSPSSSSSSLSSSSSVQVGFHWVSRIEAYRRLVRPDGSTSFVWLGDSLVRQIFLHMIQWIRGRGEYGDIYFHRPAYYCILNGVDYFYVAPLNSILPFYSEVRRKRQAYARLRDKARKEMKSETSLPQFFEMFYDYVGLDYMRYGMKLDDQWMRYQEGGNLTEPAIQGVLRGYITGRLPARLWRDVRHYLFHGSMFQYSDKARLSPFFLEVLPKFYMRNADKIDTSVKMMKALTAGPKYGMAYLRRFDLDSEHPNATSIVHAKAAGGVRLEEAVSQQRYIRSAIRQARPYLKRMRAAVDKGDFPLKGIVVFSYWDNRKSFGGKTQYIQEAVDEFTTIIGMGLPVHFVDTSSMTMFSRNFSDAGVAPNAEDGMHFMCGWRPFDPGGPAHRTAGARRSQLGIKGLRNLQAFRKHVLGVRRNHHRFHTESVHDPFRGVLPLDCSDAYNHNIVQLLFNLELF